MGKTRKILIGGVPFGRNNVGDEAILQGTVHTLREVFPGAHITVSTDDGHFTRRKLHVDTIDLVGFGHKKRNSLMRYALKEHDLFVWSGATGLSDYPHIPLEILSTAQKVKTPSVLWGVGMNSEINPVHYKVLPGRRQELLNLVSKATLGSIDAIKAVEDYKLQSIQRWITKALSKADLVVLRDPQSGESVQTGGDIEDLIIGADAALQLKPALLEDIVLTPSVLRVLHSDQMKVGICISAQQQLQQCDKMCAFIDRLISELGTKVLFVPMNPVTDTALMTQMMHRLQQPEHAAVVSGYYEPEEVLAIVENLDLIISSRLHLLIFSSIAHVPMIGIARGSKVDNFLDPFGLQAAGDVEDCDFDHLWDESTRLLQNKDDFQELSSSVRKDLLKRFDTAKDHLREV